MLLMGVATEDVEHIGGLLSTSAVEWLRPRRECEEERP